LSLCPRDAPGCHLTWHPSYLLFPVRPVDSCLDVTAGTPFTILSVTSFLLPGGPSPCTPHYSASFGYYAAALLTAHWHFRVCHPGWSPSADPAVQDFPSSEVRDDRTFSCLLHAGWAWEQRGLGGESLTPATLPFWFRCKSHFHLLVLTTLTRRFLASAWVQDWSVNRLMAGSCRTFVRRLQTRTFAKRQRPLRSPYAVVLAYLLSE
jgi:hypothetical protein